MYEPSQFVQQDPERIAALVAAHPLAMLVTRDESDGLCADPVPMLLEPGGPHGVLRGHVARANPLWQRAGQPVLAVFQGPDAYVSPSWYASKQAHGKVVPTWNYAVVQAHGPLRAIDDPEWLRGLLARLTDRHEAHRPSRWQLGDAPEDFIAQTLRAIVGIEIEVTRLTGKWKVSQNRPESDRRGVEAGLRQERSSDPAEAMADLVAGHGRP